MTAYAVGLESQWEGAWLPLGSTVRIDAASPPAALALIDRDSVGLRPGVAYRVRLHGPDGDHLTEHVQAPAFPARFS